MKKLIHSSYLFCLTLCMFVSAHKIQACTGRDVIFTSITFTSIATGDYEYSYVIKNIGTVDIAFNQLVIQNTVSTDNQVGGDAAAGGTFIDNTSSGVLAAGATYSGTYAAYPFAANPQSSYPYLIAQIYLNTDPECDVTNNYFPVLVQLPAGIPSSRMADASVNWLSEIKSFIVNNWPGKSDELKYSVYNSGGSLMLSGHTKEKEPTPLHDIANGMYILYLSDGQKIYTKKIVY